MGASRPGGRCWARRGTALRLLLRHGGRGTAARPRGARGRARPRRGPSPDRSRGAKTHRPTSGACHAGGGKPPAPSGPSAGCRGAPPPPGSGSLAVPRGTPRRRPGRSGSRTARPRNTRCRPPGATRSQRIAAAGTGPGTCGASLGPGNRSHRRSVPEGPPPRWARGASDGGRPLPRVSSGRSRRCRSSPASSSFTAGVPDDRLGGR